MTTRTWTEVERAPNAKARAGAAHLLLYFAMFSACSTGHAPAGAVSVPSTAADADKRSVALPARPVFRHPGVLVTGPGLAFVKAQIAAGREPWTSALAKVRADRLSSLDGSPTPFARVICGSYSKPDIGCSAEKRDTQAAYTHALLWALTGEDAHAQKAIEFMNAWARVLASHENSNAPLQAAWSASVWPRAAEIMRGYPGWAKADIARFAGMLKELYLPLVVNGHPSSNGNWELSMIEATLGMAVFLDDRSLFDHALTMWRKRVPAYVYLTSDGPQPVPPPRVSHPNLQRYWYEQATFPQDGIGQETCRDLGHMQYGLAAIIDVAETALIQGVDLYADEAKRIVAALNFHAPFVLGEAPPPWLCGGSLNSTKPNAMWEIAYNHYSKRMGMTLPKVAEVIAKVRPTGTNHHMVWETLTHAETGRAGFQ